MHIIATDDEQSALNVLMGAIREAVPLATVHGFRNPLEALEFIKNTKCDIAFLDISMRGMSGLALAEEILKIRPKCKIIFCTGYTEYALDAIKLHCSVYLTKPITKESVQKELDYIKGLNNSDEQLKVKCFGNFEVFINGEVLQFKRSKTKELFAFLVDRNGSGVTNKEICAVLWEHKENDSRNLNYLYQLLEDLKETLKNNGLEDVLVKTSRTYAVKTELLNCDYYSYLKTGSPRFRGEYMIQYSWAETTSANLSQI